MPPLTRIDSIILKRRILIICGTGGVGKTTLSSAIALRAALLGNKSVVITIDPAKRLATALGLQSLSDDPTDLTPILKSAYSEVRGSLAAISPDTRKTFESLIMDLIPSSALAHRIKQNPIFKTFAKEFSGTNEYMALERLYALDSLQKYDSIILDTPPSRNTLALFDASHLLGEFFDERILKWLVLPTHQFLAGSVRKALGLLEKLTGSSFMTHLLDLATTLMEVRTQFALNLKKITELLQSPHVGFLMVTTPVPERTKEVSHFIQAIKDHSFHFEGVALNRTLGYLDLNQMKMQSQQDHPALARARQIIEGLQQREKKAIHDFHQNQIPLCAQLPELARDVHSMEDLIHVAMAFEHECPEHICASRTL